MLVWQRGRTLSRIVTFRSSKQATDEAASKFLRADTVVQRRRGRSCRVPLEIDDNRLDLLGEPGAVEPPQDLHVIGTREESPDFIVLMREQDCFAAGPVGVLDSHEPIVPLGGIASQSWLVQEGSVTDRSKD